MKIKRFLKRNWFIVLSYYFITILIMLAVGYQNDSEIKNISKYGITASNARVYKIDSEGKLKNRDILNFLKINNSYKVQITINQNNGIFAVASNENINIPMLEGDINQLFKSNDNICVIGKNVSFYYEEDGIRYIDIDNEKYKVVGIMGEKYDNFVYLNLSSPNLLDKKVFSSWCIDVQDEGDNFDKDLMSEISKKEQSCIINKKIVDNQNDIFSQKSIYILIFIFVIITLISNSYFWIRKIEKEFAVRIMLGAYNIKIYGCLFLYQMEICIASVLLFISTYYISNILSMDMYCEFIYVGMINIFMLFCKFYYFYI